MTDDRGTDGNTGNNDGKAPFKTIEYSRDPSMPEPVHTKALMEDKNHQGDGDKGSMTDPSIAMPSPFHEGEPTGSEPENVGGQPGVVNITPSGPELSNPPTEQGNAGIVDTEKMGKEESKATKDPAQSPIIVAEARSVMGPKVTPEAPALDDTDEANDATDQDDSEFEYEEEFDAQELLDGIERLEEAQKELRTSINTIETSMEGGAREETIAAGMEAMKNVAQTLETIKTSMEGGAREETIAAGMEAMKNVAQTLETIKTSMEGGAREETIAAGMEAMKNVASTLETIKTSMEGGAREETIAAGMEAMKNVASTLETIKTSMEGGAREETIAAGMEAMKNVAQTLETIRAYMEGGAKEETIAAGMEAMKNVAQTLETIKTSMEGGAREETIAAGMEAMKNVAQTLGTLEGRSTEIIEGVAGARTRIDALTSMLAEQGGMSKEAMEGSMVGIERFEGLSGDLAVLSERMTEMMDATVASRSMLDGTDARLSTVTELLQDTQRIIQEQGEKDDEDTGDRMERTISGLIEEMQRLTIHILKEGGQIEETSHGIGLLVARLDSLEQTVRESSTTETPEVGKTTPEEVYSTDMADVQSSLDNLMEPMLDTRVVQEELRTLLEVMGTSLSDLRRLSRTQDMSLGEVGSTLLGSIEDVARKVGDLGDILSEGIQTKGPQGIDPETADHLTGLMDISGTILRVAEANEDRIEGISETIKSLSNSVDEVSTRSHVLDELSIIPTLLADLGPIPVSLSRLDELPTSLDRIGTALESLGRLETSLSTISEEITLLQQSTSSLMERGISSDKESEKAVQTEMEDRASVAVDIPTNVTLDTSEMLQRLEEESHTIQTAVSGTRGAVERILREVQEDFAHLRSLPVILQRSESTSDAMEDVKTGLTTITTKLLGLEGTLAGDTSGIVARPSGQYAGGEEDHGPSDTGVPMFAPPLAGATGTTVDRTSLDELTATIERMAETIDLIEAAVAAEDENGAVEPMEQGTANTSGMDLTGVTSLLEARLEPLSEQLGALAGLPRTLDDMRDSISNLSTTAGTTPPPAPDDVDERLKRVLDGTLSPRLTNIIDSLSRAMADMGERMDSLQSGLSTSVPKRIMDVLDPRLDELRDSRTVQTQGPAMGADVSLDGVEAGLADILTEIQDGTDRILERVETIPAPRAGRDDSKLQDSMVGLEDIIRNMAKDLARREDVFLDRLDEMTNSLVGLEDRLDGLEVSIRNVQEDLSTDDVAPAVPPEPHRRDALRPRTRAPSREDRFEAEEPRQTQRSRSDRFVEERPRTPARSRRTVDEGHDLDLGRGRGSFPRGSGRERKEETRSSSGEIDQVISLLGGSETPARRTGRDTRTRSRTIGNIGDQDPTAFFSGGSSGRGSRHSSSRDQGPSRRSSSRDVDDMDPDDDRLPCKYCGRRFKPAGLPRHMSACKKKRT